MSEAGVRELPAACSGDMYAAVPSAVAGAVSVASPDCASRAIPKSTTLAARRSPSPSSMTLFGFTSRWMTPTSWAAPRPAATWAVHSTASCQPMLPANSPRLGPLSSSMTMKASRGSSKPASKTRTTLG